VNAACSYADRRNRKEPGAVRCDKRILNIKPEKRLVSIATLRGRIKVPFAAGRPQLRLPGPPVRGRTSRLFYLAMACKAEGPRAKKAGGVLAVDPGQVNPATESTGEAPFGGRAHPSASAPGRPQATPPEAGHAPRRVCLT
jgi:hypothetical protein